MNSNQNVSKYLQSMRLPSGLSKVDEDFLKTALCVPDAGAYQYTGVPDKDCAPSFLRHTTQELDINMNTWYNATPANNGSTVEIVMWPWERQEVLFGGLTSNESIVAVNSGELGVNTGGVGIYVQPPGGSIFPKGSALGTSLNADPVNAGAGQVIVAPDSFYAGERGRMVATWLEIVPTGADNYSTGAGLSWEVTRSPVRTKLSASNNYNAFVINGKYNQYQTSADMYPNGPNTIAEARQFFKVEDWEKITDGCFMPCLSDFDECEAQYPCVRDKYIEAPSILTQNTIGTVNGGTGFPGGQNTQTSNTRACLVSGTMVQAIASSTTTTVVDQFNTLRNYHSNRRLRGVILSNLNTGSAAGSTTVANSFKIVVNYVWESFPDGSNALTAAAARQSPQYSPKAIEVYENIAENLPISFPLSWNKKRTYLNLVQQAIIKLKPGPPRVIASKMKVTPVSKPKATQMQISVTGPGQKGKGKAKKKATKKSKGKQLLLKL